MEQWLSIWSIGQDATLNDLNIIKEAGFNGVEIWTEHIRSNEYLDYAKQTGLQMGLHLPFHDLNLGSPDPIVFERTLSVLNEWIEKLSKYGGHHATFHGGYAWASEEREETLVRVKERIKTLSEKAKENGIDLLLENLIPDRLNYCHHIASNVEEWFDLIHETKVKACLDIGHLAVMGNDTEEVITKLGSSLGAVHFSDNDRHSDLHLLPGEGADISKGAVEFLEKVGFNGPIVYEINPYKYTLQDIVKHITSVKEAVK